MESKLHWPTVGLVGVPSGLAILGLAGYIWLSTVERVVALEHDVGELVLDVAEIKGDVKVLVEAQNGLRLWLSSQFARVLQ